MHRIFYRLMVALLIGVLCGGLSYWRLLERHALAADFTFPWRAAQLLLSGANPYTAILPTGSYPYQTYFYYPLTAAIAALPFAGLPPVPAGALFFGLSSALLAYALTRGGLHRLTVFLGAPFGVALAVAQWPPLLLAAALLPGLEFLLACKPNLGAALFAARPTWRGLAGLWLFGHLSLLLVPAWPTAWLAVTRGLQGHPSPLLTLPLGPLLLLGLLRWRTWRGRLLLLMAVMPQLLFFYDQLPLALLPRTWRSGLAYAALTWLGYALWRFTGGVSPTAEVLTQPTQPVMLFVFLPAIILVLKK